MTLKQLIKSPLIIRPVVAAAIAFGLMSVIGSDVNADLIMSTLCGSSDIEVSDFYNRIHAGGSAKPLSDKYIVVNIDTVTDRADMAALIDATAAGRPRIIGVDAIFSTPRDATGDSLLAASLAAAPAVVAQRYSDADGAPVADFISETLPGTRRGMANLTSQSGHGIVREITPFLDSARTAPALPVAMLAALDPGAYARLRERSGDELLRFSNEEFYVAEPSEILDDPDLCRDRIVLLGTVTDMTDLHATPLADEFPGVMIHSHALDMMLRGDYVNPASHIYNLVLELLACLLMTVLYVYLDAAQNFVMRILPIVWMLAILWLGCYAFSYLGVYLNAPRTMLMAALSLFVLDTWYAFETPVRRAGRRIRSHFGHIPSSSETTES